MQTGVLSPFQTRKFNNSLPEYLNWTLPSLNLTMSAGGFQSKIETRMTNSVDPDETARHEPSHQDLHCLQRYLLWSARLKGLIDVCLCALSPFLHYNKNNFSGLCPRDSVVL